MEIIVGKKKAGKTKYILEKMKDILRENESLEYFNRSKIYMLVPDQYTNMYERLLTENLSLGTLTDVEIISFSRLASLVFLDTEYRNINFIDSISRKIIISDLIENMDFKILKKDRQQTAAISKSISDFKSFGLSPSEVLDKTSNFNESDEILKMKLEDLSKVYDAYEEFLKDEYIDEEDILKILFEILNKKSYFSNAYVFMDKFNSLDNMQKNVFKEIAKSAKDVYVSFLSEDISKTKEAENRSENEVKKEYSEDIFSEVKKTIYSILNIFDEIKEERKKEGKNAVTKYVYLEEENTFSKQISVFEKIYSGEKLNIEEEKTRKEEIKDIKFLGFKDTKNEFRYIALDILKKINEEGYSLKDFLIISNNIEEDGINLKTVLDKFNIDVNISEEKNILNNIYIEYILTILKAAYFKNSEDILSLLKLGILDFKEEDIEALEKYIIKWNISGYKWNMPWSFGKKEEYFESVNYAKEKIVQFLNNFKEKIDAENTGEKKLIKLYEHLEEIKIFENVLSKINDEHIKDEYFAVINILNETLDKIAYIYKEKDVKTEVLINILEESFKISGLKSFPNKTNAVDVRSIESASDNKKIIYIVSSEEEHMPKNLSSLGIISDSEKDVLKANGVEFLKTNLENINNFEYTFYDAAFSASDKIILTYAIKDILGNSKRRSMYFKKIQNIFPKFKEEIFEDEILNFEKIKYLKYMEDEEKEKQIIKELASYKYAMYLSNENTEKIDDFSKLVIKKLRSKGKFKNEEKEAFNKNESEDLRKDILDRIYKEKIYTSISRIESFSKCPFAYNIKYNVRAIEKEKYELKPFDTGNFIHKSLELFAKKIKDEIKTYKEKMRNVPFYEIDDEEIKNEYLEYINEKAKETIDEVLQSPDFEIFLNSKKFIYLSKKLSKILFFSLLNVAESLRLSNFEIYKTEYEIKAKIFENIFEKFKKEIYLKGIIDRIDILEDQDKSYFRIIDYKSSEKDIKPKEIYSGINLQMPIYADLIEKNEELKNAGLLYYAVNTPNINEKIENKNEIYEKAFDALKMKGILLGDENILKSMDKSLTDGRSKSTFLPVTFKQNGELGARSKTLDEENLNQLILDSKDIAEKILEDMLSGKNDISPLEEACTYCKYKNICMVDKNKNKIRKYKRINKWKIK